VGEIGSVLTTRLVKMAMIASTALFALLVTFNNLSDYNSNYQFVRHTLTMDTTFPGNALMGRAITSPALWAAGYWAIIATEAAVGLTLAFAAAKLAINLRSNAANFNAAKKYAIVGAGLGFLLWFTGFIVVGGEWFLMWQSKGFNGQEPAFRFYMTLLAVVIFLTQPDGELDA
jgi:predicted small integral membrane protein